MGQRSVPAPFLIKTYELVDDPKTDDVVSWGENGTTFVVWNTADFSKDLLPNYFKHNNFSSFVRQLNTYGFRKIVPDKWEFANDNFKRGEKSLLSAIRRRKATATLPSTPAKKPLNNNQSQSVSGEEAGSTSTSSPGSVEIADISGENEKLRRDNEMLSSELAQTKKQCDELMTFLTRHLNVGPEKVSEILRGTPPNSSAYGAGAGAEAELGTCASGVVVNDNDNDDDDDKCDGDEDGASVNERKKIEEEGLKLFGVWLKEVDGKKRGRCGGEINNDHNKHNLGLSGPNCGQKVARIR